jgi:hypothetical protein
MPFVRADVGAVTAEALVSAINTARARLLPGNEQLELIHAYEPLGISQGSSHVLHVTAEGLSGDARQASMGQVASCTDALLPAQV